ncbi:MAG: hypothetical protein RLZZ457_1110, partial [Pseudomonadota bacterium]
MNTSTLAQAKLTGASEQQAPAAAQRVIALLKRLQHGTLHVQWPNGSVEQFGTPPSNSQGLNATLHLHSWA